jgi:hypothetical protein
MTKERSASIRQTVQIVLIAGTMVFGKLNYDRQDDVKYQVLKLQIMHESDQQKIKALEARVESDELMCRTDKKEVVMKIDDLKEKIYLMSIRH